MMVVRLREGMLRLAEQFPEFVTQSQITAVVEQATRELGNLSGTLLENAFSQVFSLFVLQFGWSWELGWIMAAYGLIQFLDGNVLVPLLFSEAVDLHPITIIISVLAFGGMAGLWGVFFAIPLATLIKAIYVAWPRQSEEAPPTG